MADFPALPLWTDAYLADTLDLDMADHGIYLLMLMLAWRRPDCALPDDMAWLKRSLAACGGGLHGHTFNARVPRLLDRFWTLHSDGTWHQKRLDKERVRVAGQSDQKRQSALKRWSKSSQNDFKTSSKYSQTDSGFEQNQRDSECTRNATRSRSRSKKKEDASGKEKAGDGTEASAPTPTIERLFRTVRAEVGEAAFRAWFAPLEVVGEVNGSLTLSAPTRFHRDRVAGCYGSRLETIAGLPVEIVVAGAAPIERPPAAPPPPPRIRASRRSSKRCRRATPTTAPAIGNLRATARKSPLVPPL